MLIDTADMAEHFSKSEMHLLTQLEMECPNRTHTKWYKRPLLTIAGNTNEIFYTPWLPVDPLSGDLKSVREKFASYVEAKRKTSSVEIFFRHGF